MPRIPLCPFDDEMFPFRFKRKQFLVKLSFAMTINKAQGQTIPNVGVYLPEPVFSHGQLYVMLSRATTAKNIRILMTEQEYEDEGEDEEKKKKKKGKGEKTKNKKKQENKSTSQTYTKNIVFIEVLTK